MKLNPLTPEEAHIILGKGTEIPFSGEYDSHKEFGVYRCRQCDTPLFLSEMKFDSGCGWPSFDDAIPGRVNELPDSDGRRMEIQCENCGGHLGHVFTGEHITPKNTRHCVNSLSLKFEKVDDEEEITNILENIGISNASRGSTSSENDEDNVNTSPKSKKINRAYFGGGCFWCTEAVFSRLRGVVDVHSGYMGGRLPNPTFERVASGSSGYIEIVEVVYDPAIISYEILLSVFFSTHDPTSRDHQGNDRGEQYRSIIFGSPVDLEAATNFIEMLQKENTYKDKIVTELRSLDTFYRAEEYHQKYYENHSTAAYCEYIIDPKIAKLREKFSRYLKDKD